MAFTQEEKDIWKSILEATATAGQDFDIDGVAALAEKTEAEKKVLIKESVQERLDGLNASKTKTEQRIVDVTAQLNRIKK